MYALSMYEEYLLVIFKGVRPCDVRLHPTNKRGKIALIKSKTNRIYGYVDFISIDQISYEDYVYWHVGENFTYEDAEYEIESNNYLGQNKFKRAYMYNFKNPVLFDIPKKITILNKTGSWIEFDEKEIQEGYKNTY